MQTHYSESVISSFLTLRKQYRRCVSSRGIDRYSEIEKHPNFTTYNRFLNSCDDFFWYFYKNEPTSETAQQVFDRLNNIERIPKKRVIQKYHSALDLMHIENSKKMNIPNW